MSIQNRSTTTPRKTAKPRSSKARTQTATKSSRPIVMNGSSVALQAPMAQLSHDLQASLAAAGLLMADAKQAVSELASTAGQRARGAARHAVTYAREHPTQVLMSAVALGFVAARLWSTRRSVT